MAANKIDTKSAKKCYREGTDYQFETPEATLGPWTSRLTELFHRI
ncbi:MAG: hypothetical protein NT010_03090 [Proteobacteria bacterium]|nr:hypothetical protein [Pseudomonadota bacterium]